MATSISFRVHNVHFDIYLTQSLFQDHMMAALTPSVTSAFNKKKKKGEEERQQQLCPSQQKLGLLEAALFIQFFYGLNYVPQN